MKLIDQIKAVEKERSAVAILDEAAKKQREERIIADAISRGLKKAETHWPDIKENILKTVKDGKDKCYKYDLGLDRSSTPPPDVKSAFSRLKELAAEEGLTCLLIDVHWKGNPDPDHPGPSYDIWDFKVLFTWQE